MSFTQRKLFKKKIFHEKKYFFCHRSNHAGKSPQILIDLKECAHIFVQRDEMGIILGGRFNFYNFLLKQLLENFKAAGAKLVFFMPGKCLQSFFVYNYVVIPFFYNIGHKYTDDLQFFIPKTEETYSNALKTLDNIDENHDLEMLKQYLDEKNKLSCDIRMVLAFNHNLKRLVRSYGDYHVNFIRHNQEIARYANEHSDVLAVISNDTDFMAFEGDFEFWRANGINCKQLSCFRYCKNKLHEKLEFDYGPYQMQLLR